MKNNRSHKKFKYVFFIILCMGIGFAALTATINFNGVTNLFGNSWEVYLDNVQMVEGSEDTVTGQLPTISNRTTIDYQVTLDQPGKYFAFTVDAVNDGTIDAMVSILDNTTLSADMARKFTYQITYLDDTPINREDLLPAHESLTYKVYLKYSDDVLESDLFVEDTSLNLSFTLVYTVPKGNVVRETQFTKMVKDSAVLDTDINFASNSSDSNGKGLYLLSSSQRDSYPIYYYRGAVTNNNAKFAGLCWKIVRTTETGGVKLVYNGAINGKGGCTNTTGDSTNIGYTPFNPNSNSLAYLGYMYGNTYISRQFSSGSLYISSFGRSFVYSDGNYTLKGVHSSFDSSHRYVCVNETGEVVGGTTCSKLGFMDYYYYDSSSRVYRVYVTQLPAEKDLNGAIQEMETNTNDSDIKMIVDNWFVKTIKKYFDERSLNYNSYIEDTIWCNDRSRRSDSVYNANGGREGLSETYAYSRFYNGAPSLKCPRKEDAFTVGNIIQGNGKLTYPIGLLTSDEVNMAGGTTSSNSTYYLYTNQDWWTMSAGATQYHLPANMIYIATNGVMGKGSSNTSYGIRPSISVASNVKIKSGTNGTSANPYEFIVD